MVPAIFSFHFQGQGQRQKVTALEFIGPVIILRNLHHENKSV